MSRPPHRDGTGSGSAPILLKKLCCKLTGLPDGKFSVNRKHANLNCNEFAFQIELVFDSCMP
mgnify:CR=1 FL=1